MEDMPPDVASRLTQELMQAMADYDAVRMQSICEALDVPFESESCERMTWPRLYETLHARSYAWKVLQRRAEVADPLWLDAWRQSGHADANFIPDADDVIRICAERDHPPAKTVGPGYGHVDYAICLCGKQSWARAHAPVVDNPVDETTVGNDHNRKGA